MSRGIYRHPQMKDMVCLVQPGPMGDALVVPTTPELENLIREGERQAGMRASQALAERATLADFDQAHAKRTMHAFCQWATMNQIPPREAMALELQASMEGKPFTPDMQAMANGRPMQRDPRERTARPLANDDLDTLNVSPSATLDELKRLGVIDEDMSEEQFDARLKRLRMDVDSRVRLTATAYEQGWFNGNGLAPAPERVSGEYPYMSTPNGSTLLEFRDDSPLKLRPGVVANIKATRDRAQAIVDETMELLRRAQASEGKP